MANVKSLIIKGTDLLDLIYPVGVIFETTKKDFDPNGVFNGTWTRIKGKVLVGVDENDTDFASSKATGGEKTHTLLGTEMPTHNHGIRTVDVQNRITGWTNLNRVARSGSSYDIVDASTTLIANAGGGVPTTTFNRIIQYICGREQLSHYDTSKWKGGLING